MLYRMEPKDTWGRFGFGEYELVLTIHCEFNQRELDIIKKYDLQEHIFFPRKPKDYLIRNVVTPVEQNLRIKDLFGGGHVEYFDTKPEAAMFIKEFHVQVKLLEEWLDNNARPLDPRNT